MNVRACVVHGAKDLRIEDQVASTPGAGEIAVDVAVGGICGSDLHYFHDGAVGDFAIRQPMILGHEVVGHVALLGDRASTAVPGTPVAVHPATPCGECPECRDGRRNVCRQTRFLGSAARMPHVQGGFVQRLIVPEAQVRVLPADLDLKRAVLAEPLSVALHAVRRAGSVAGSRVLVTGAGPIGCLVVAALRAAGAAEIVVSDLLDAPLALARRVGATSVVRADQRDDPAWPDEVDAAIEASGTAGGLRSCIERSRRGATIVMLGLLPPGEVGVLGNVVVTRELTLRGAFRFDTEFDDALTLLAGGLDVGDIVTHTFPLDQANEAFELAGDRSVASKVLLDFSN